MQSAAVVRSFDGKPLEFQTWKGRPCVTARSLGAVLGYEQPRKLVEQIRGPWREEFVEGHDVDVLDGADIAEWKRLDTETVSSGPDRTPSLTILYETGARLAAIKARTKVGARVRRWLVEVWAEIARTGQFRASADPSTAPPSPAPIDGAPVAMVKPQGRVTVLVRWHRGRPCVTAADLAQHLHISRADLLVAQATRGQYGHLAHGVDFAFVEGAELVPWAKAQAVDLESDARPVMVFYETGARAVCGRGTQTEARRWLADLWRTVPTPPVASSSARRLPAPELHVSPAAERDAPTRLGSHFAWSFLGPEAMRINAQRPRTEQVPPWVFAFIADWTMPEGVPVTVATVEALARFAKSHIGFEAPTPRVLTMRQKGTELTRHARV